MFSAKIFILLACSLVIAAASPVDNANGPGGVVEMTEAEIQKYQKEVQVTLNELESNGDPHFEVSKVNSATKQIVEGIMVKMNVDLVNKVDGAEKNCNISIWSRVWIPNGVETTIECEGEDAVEYIH